MSTPPVFGNDDDIKLAKEGDATKMWTKAQIEESLEDGVVAIGEDGACAVKAKDVAEAARLIRAYICENVDHETAEKVTENDLISMWATPYTLEDIEGDSEKAEYGWYVAADDGKTDRSVQIWYCKE